MTASLVDLADQCVTAEPPISLVPQSFVSLLEHQSDAPEAPVFMDQDSVLATVSNSVSRAVLLEILAEEAIRTIRADGGEEEESSTGTEHEDSHQVTARRSGRRVMSTARSASPSGWASDELFVLRDVSIPSGTPCHAYFSFQKTLFGQPFIWRCLVEHEN